MDLKEYEKISLQLIELVKPHEILYSCKSYECPIVRRKLWIQIANEMNRKFGTKHRREHWKNRWQTLRSIYRSGMQSNKRKDNNILSALEFLRPYIRRDTITMPKERKSAKNDESSIVLVETTTSAITKAQNHLNRQQLNDYGNQTNNDSIVIDDSDSESNCEIVQSCEPIEPIRTAYEIYFEDNDVNDEINNKLIATNAKNFSDESFMDDGDETFLTLIGKELCKMTPSARQQFKRNVTQLLYS